MLIGPVFTREAVTTTRRARFYVNRAVYVAALFVLMCTAWLVLAGTQVIRNVGDMARFGSILFQIVAPLQLSLMLFFSAVLAARAVAQESPSPPPSRASPPPPSPPPAVVQTETM